MTGRIPKVKRVFKHDMKSYHQAKPLLVGISKVKGPTSRLLLMAGLALLLTVLCAPELLSLYQDIASNKRNQSQHTDVPPSMDENVSPFIPTYQKDITPKKIFLEGRRIAPIELKSNVSHSAVKVFLFDGFLSHTECDSLRMVHDKHIKSWAEAPPLLCFESLDTLKKNVERSGMKESTLDDLSNKIFLDGSRCLNTTYSAQVADLLHHNWSYSTAFYPGETQFSKKLAAVIKETTGLRKENGGKFQITSYPPNVGYKQHTDCMENRGREKRDRMATVLIYLDDVEEGGETAFPELGISVKPVKGRALLWNNMNPDGACDPLSTHEANPVTKGHKYILQRWYYHESFRALGTRPDPPPLPLRSPEQAMVSCDEYKHGSCRWYDEWSYDVMEDYRLRKFSLK